MDKEKIKRGICLIIEGIGEDAEREGLRDTPARVADMYEEMFARVDVNSLNVITVTFAEDHDEMVLVKDIPLHSICEDHLIPFVGRAHVAYIPGEDGRVTGLSKLARVVDVEARRPQLQERLTSKIADVLVTALDPLGVMVVVEVEHLCMRGVHALGTPSLTMVTSAVRGIFRTNEASREEVLSLIKGRARGLEE